MDQGSNKRDRNRSQHDMRLTEADLDALADEKFGLDFWITSSIEGKRREMLKRQMLRQINRMKALQFDFFDFKV
ncbi:hypothetical protein JXL19_11535 [bacterium]|nr:hypothetical protein [bacterium]